MLLVSNNGDAAPSRSDSTPCDHAAFQNADTLKSSLTKGASRCFRSLPSAANHYDITIFIARQL